MTNEVIIGILITIVLSWAGWVSLSILNHSRKLEANEQKIVALETIHSDIEELKELITSLNKRFDTFIKQEIDELKNILRDEKH